MIKTLLNKAFGKGFGQNTITTETSLVPDGQRVYAIGDIHGRLDLLRELLRAIEADAADTAATKTIIYLGDYIDRGNESRGVIDFLLQYNPPDFKQIYLMGNHEEFILRFFEYPAQAASWLDYGGMETLLSYSVSMQPGVMNEKKLKQVSDDLIKAMPETHVDFLNSLIDSYELGDYFFCHAGVNPARPLHKQAPEDLRWIRKPFTSHLKPYTKIIVHGHTISEQPELRPNRISIDTGAYHSGQLTCLVLEGKEKRFIQTPIN